MHITVYLLFITPVLLSVCTPTIQQKTAGFAVLVKPGETVAVTAIYKSRVVM